MAIQPEIPYFDEIIIYKGGTLWEKADIAVKSWLSDNERFADLAVLACEAQNEIHYAMPVRNMTQDGIILYGTDPAFVATAEKRERERTTDEKADRSRVSFTVWKDDRIFPIITLVFYYDVKKWDGAVDLYDMFRINEELKDEKILKKYIPNYRINLIDAGNMEHLEQFIRIYNRCLGC